MPIEPAALDRAAEQMADAIVSWRRHLHAHPELSFEEEETARWIGERLDEFGIPWQRVPGTNSLVATLHGRAEGVARTADGTAALRTVALRADIDALPIQEQTDLPFRSRFEGRMHACGHDGHTAMLLGAGALLAQNSDFFGRIKLIFQAAEESPPGGALAVIEAGALADVDRIYALHLTTAQPTGKAEIRAGAAMANVDRFDLTVTGRAGHAAKPHECVDAVYVAAELVGQLQSIVSRCLDPLTPAVVTVGTLRAGTAFNVIAGEAHLSGTVRTFTEEARRQVREAVDRIAAGVCSAHGAQYKLRYEFGYPAVVNDPVEVERFRRAAEAVLGAGSVQGAAPIMAGDDFAYYLQRCPGAYLRLGCGNADKGAVFPNHHPCFVIDEDALVLGTRILVRVALDALGAPGFSHG